VGSLSGNELKNNPKIHRPLAHHLVLSKKINRTQIVMMKLISTLKFLRAKTLAWNTDQKISVNQDNQLNRRSIPSWCSYCLAIG